MPEIEIRKGQILQVAESGSTSAPALVLITGLGGLKEGWFRQVPYFARTYRVVTPNNRGMGGSTVVDRPTRMVDLASDVVALLDRLHIDSAHIFGVSMGGKIAQELALGWPDRVRRLVLGCTTAGSSHRVDQRATSKLRDLPTQTEADIMTHMIPLLFGPDYRERRARAMVAFARSRVRHPPNPIAIARQWQAYEHFDSWDRLPEITHRTLVITGEADVLTAPANTPKLAERLPNAVAYTVPKAGHSFHIEQPEEVNRVVGSFLATGSVG